ncbi:MAG TPA: protein-tyrosine phosphatase family protein [Thermoanaerobaculia bacterium]|jgi:protein-tyrosine phosphatase|nr:protein-tyrosine phosphatase family protein [Thermoanaerobaculia bacterium]
MPRADVYWVPGPWPGRLGIVPRPRGGDWLADEVRSWRESGLSVVVSLLTPEEVAEFGLESEAELSRRAGLEFRSLSIPDLGVPPSRAAMADLAESLEQALAAGKGVAVHCRQGIGRSSLAVASVLVAAGVSSGEAFRDIAAARGTSVPETPEQRRWVETFASMQDRKAKVA